MPTETSYSNLRENLASYLDKVVDDQDVVIVRRKGARDVAMIPAGELEGLMETAQLLRPPTNAKRLLSALKRARNRSTKPSTLDVLRRDVGLEPKS